MNLKIHFVGIGGMGLSALALWARSQGYRVTGSDLNNGPMIEILKGAGIEVTLGKNEIIGHPDFVVRSSAVTEESIKGSVNVKILERMDFLSANIKPLVGITGTDGKSSTTLMVEWIALKNGLDPSMICGAVPLGLSNATFRGGKGGMVLEVDESDPGIENISSEIAVLTNLRYDHLDRYKNDPKEQLRVVNNFLKRAKRTVIPYDFDFGGTIKFGEYGDVTYNHISSDFKMQNFEIRYNGIRAEVHLPIAGIHQMANATAAISAGILLGFSLDRCAAALSSYPGLKRRLEVLHSGDITVIDDYAHTPDEARAALDSVRPYFKNVVAIFEPHRYTRLLQFHDEFSSVLSMADEIYVTQIFGAFEVEKKIDPIDVVQKIRLSGKNAYFAKVEEVSEILSKKMKPGLYLFMGAGNITHAAQKFAEVAAKW